MSLLGWFSVLLWSRDILWCERDSVSVRPAYTHLTRWRNTFFFRWVTLRQVMTQMIPISETAALRFCVTEIQKHSEASRGSWTFKVAFCYWSTERETLLTSVAPLGFIFLSLCHRDILETSEQIFTGGTASSEPRTLRSFGSELDLGFLPFDNWKWS